MDHEQRELFDRRGDTWPPPTSTTINCQIEFCLRTDDPGYEAAVRIWDGTTDELLEWSNHELAYTVGGWAQAMALVAWQLERARHYLKTFD
jgi:hypothetical protein